MRALIICAMLASLAFGVAYFSEPEITDAEFATLEEEKRKRDAELQKYRDSLKDAW